MGKLKKRGTEFHSADDIDYMIKLCGICNLFICSLGVAASYLFYGSEIGSDNNSWIIGIVLSVIGTVFYLVIFFNKNLSPVVRWSGAGVIINISFSYLFTNLTVSPFIYSPMPLYINVSGLIFVLIVHFYWIAYSAKNIHLIFTTPELLSVLYKEEDGFYTYSNGIHQKIIEEKLSRRFFPHPALWVLIIALSPVSFFLHKLFIPAFGVSNFQMVLALISLPIALLFNGLTISTILVSFYYPSKLRKLTGKNIKISSRLA